MIFRPGSLVLLILGILPLAMPSVAVAQKTAVATRSALDTLPGNTTFVLRVANCSGAEKKFKNSPMYALGDDPGIKKFLDEAKKRLEEGLSEMHEALGFGPLDILRSVEGEFVIAVGGLEKTIEALMMGLGGGGQPDIDPGDIPVLIQFDAGSSVGVMRGYIDKIIAYAEKNGATKSSEDFHGGTITTLENTGKQPGDGDPGKVLLATHGTSFLVSLNRPYLEASLAGLAGSPVESVSKNPGFVATAKRVGANRDLLLFVNFAEILKSVRSNVQNNPMFAMFWGLIEKNIIGQGLRNLGFGLSLEQRTIDSAFFVNDGGTRGGLLGVLDGPGFSPAEPGAIIPVDATSFSKTSLNVPHLYSIIKSIANMAMSFMGNPGVDVEQFVELNFQIKIKDIIDSIDHELTYFTGKGSTDAASPVPGFANFVVALQLKREEPIRNLLMQLGILFGGSIQNEKYLERDLYFDPSDGPSGPTLGIANKLLVFGMSRDGVKGVILRQGKGEPGVKDSESFKAVVAGLPGKVNLLEFYSAAAYRETLGFLELFPSEIPLPDLEPVFAIIEGAVSHGYWVEDGLLMKSVLKFKKCADSRGSPKG